MSTTPVNNLLPMSLTPVINVNSVISPRIFEKIRNGPKGILLGPGDTDSWKNLKSKISCQTPFKKKSRTSEKNQWLGLGMKNLLKIYGLACGFFVFFVTFHLRCLTWSADSVIQMARRSRRAQAHTRELGAWHDQLILIVQSSNKIARRSRRAQAYTG